MAEIIAEINCRRIPFTKNARSYFTIGCDFLLFYTLLIRVTVALTAFGSELLDRAKKLD